MSNVKTVLSLTQALFITLFLLAGAIGAVSASSPSSESSSQGKVTMENTSNLAVATFAGGCFWCMEADFEKIPGVAKVVSGYTGGSRENPTYENYAASGHVEAVQIYYDPQKVSYQELLDYFWRHVDPTDPGGQFVDRGASYRSAIFYHDAEQKRLAEESKAALAQSGRFDKPIVTDILKLTEFYPAEAYHQNYYKTHSTRYKFYRWNSGRDQFLQQVWGEN